MSGLINLIGKKFGRLTVKKYAGKRMWLCECECGVVRTFVGRALRDGQSKSCGCSRFAHNNNDLLKFKSINGKNLIGKKFGKLSPIRHLGKINEKSIDQYWLCKCDCGNEKIIRSRNLANGGTRSCGCSSGKLPYGQSAFNQLRNGYKRGAKARSLCYELSDEQFRNITSKKCFYCGVPPKQSVPQFLKGKLNGDYLHNGIDRLDNSSGYTIDNCVPCCKSCNYFKSTLSMEDFLSNVERIYKHVFC